MPAPSRPYARGGLLGATLPWPLPLLAAFLAGGVLAFLVGLFALRPKRTDYQGRREHPPI